MKYERIKEISKEYSRQGYINILDGLSDEELLEAFKSLSDAMLKDHPLSNEEMTEILMLQEDVNFVIVQRWVEEHDGR